MEHAIFVDRHKCVGCYACVVACKLEHDLPPHPVRPPLGHPTGPNLIRVVRVGPRVTEEGVRQYFLPVLCLHCLPAPCIAACPHSAIYRDIETGIIAVHEDACTGCGSCLEACPYEAPQIHDDKLRLCDLCIHRPQERRLEGRTTACEAACPARALRVGRIGDISRAERS